jgi:hypothetical protein
MLTADQVHCARTSGLTDTHLSRIWRVTVATVLHARRGDTHKAHPTPPDRAPRDGNGRGMKPNAKPARVRRSYLRGC